MEVDTPYSTVDQNSGRLRCKGVSKQIVGVIPKGLALRVVQMDHHSKDESGKGFKREVREVLRNLKGMKILDTGIDNYPSYCDDDKKIHIDCGHNLMFSCMIGFEFTHVNFYPLLYVNVMSKEFHISIMKDQMVYKGDNVVGALMNVPIFVGTFYVMIDFAVLEDMDAYRDEGIGDNIVGEPFLREVGIKTKHLDGIITLYNGDDEVTYQMVDSTSRLKTTCVMGAIVTMIPTLLKVGEKERCGRWNLTCIPKLKGFYNREF
ncbi:hypothetical protein Tco_0468705 [Tanacetum coccineum]